jgi:hypothetical protein
VARITATQEQVFRVGASPLRAYAFFADLDQLRQAIPGVERCEVLPGGRANWVLEPRVDRSIRFRPDYVVTLQGNGTDHVSSRFVEGNMLNDWDVWISAGPSGTEVRYRERALLIRPLAACELRKDVNRFLDRVRQRLAD